MLAMQYSFTLPADYDMAIIERRIAEKGHLMDGFPGLLFKLYLYADRADLLTASHENLYAPFYLWQDEASMHRFLLGEGFKALTQAFGWPSVKVYPVLAASLPSAPTKAHFAARHISSIPAYSDLSELQQLPEPGGALSQVLAWDPQHWQLIRLSLWQNLSGERRPQQQHYRIGHISLP